MFTILSGGVNDGNQGPLATLQHFNTNPHEFRSSSKALHQDRLAYSFILSSISYGQSVRYVDGGLPNSGDGTSWSNAYNTIDHAIHESVSGDQIWVASGVYRETLELTDGISVYGGFSGDETMLAERDWEANPTILDASGSKRRRLVTIMDAEETTLDGFTIRNSPLRGIEYRNVDSATLANCVIRDNQMGQPVAGMLCDTAHPVVRNCEFLSNEGGIHCQNSDPRFFDCVISNNRGNTGGISCQLSDPHFFNCTITGNSAVTRGGGFHCTSSSNPVFSPLCDCVETKPENFMKGVAVVVYSSASPHSGLTIASSRTITRRPMEGRFIAMALPSNSPIALWWGTPPARISEASVRTPASSNSRMGSFGTTAPNSQTRDATPRVYSFPKSPITCVQAGHPGEGNIDAYPRFADPGEGDYELLDGSPCIDSGTDVGDSFNGAAPDLGYLESPETYTQGPTSHVPDVFFVDSDADEGGTGLSSASALKTLSEALFLCSSSDEIWVSGGTYFENISLEPGLSIYGGFFAFGKLVDERDPATYLTTIISPGTSEQVIAIHAVEKTTLDGFNVVPRHASQAGIAFQDVDSATVNNCGFYGQLSFSVSSPTVSNCVITGIYDQLFGAVYCSFSAPSFLNCTIEANSGYEAGGVYCYSSEPSFKNCQITRNASLLGSAMSLFDSSLDFLNCTVAHNEDSDDGAEIRASFSDIVFTNSILRDGEDLILGVIARRPY